MNWISVKERLPRNAGFSENVILCTRGGAVTTGWLECGEFKWWILNDADYHECVEFDFVTHWMPLPEPPTAGSGGIFLEMAKGNEVF